MVVDKIKHYDHDGLQNFPMRFMSLLTASKVKKSHILARELFIIQKKFIDQIQKSWKSLISSIFIDGCISVALFLEWSFCVLCISKN